MPQLGSHVLPVEHVLQVGSHVLPVEQVGMEHESQAEQVEQLSQTGSQQGSQQGVGQHGSHVVVQQSFLQHMVAERPINRMAPYIV